MYTLTANILASVAMQPRLLRKGKLTSSIGPSIQRRRRNTSSPSALDRHCASCLNPVPVLKEFTMRRHWEAEHRASNFASMSSEERKYAIDRLSGNLQKTTSFFRKQTDEADTILLASYEVSRILARRMKQFSNGDFIEECLVAVVDFSSTHDGSIP